MSAFQSVLAALGGLVIVLTAAAAALLRDCLPLIAAMRELRAALTTPSPAVPGRGPHSAAPSMRSSRS